MAVTMVGGEAAFAASLQVRPTEAEWQQAVAHLPALTAGCYHASYPTLQWRATPCTVAPNRPAAPALRSDSPATAASPWAVGDTVDYSAKVSGTLTEATGTFDDVSPKITETGQIDGQGPQIANEFMLQLNAQFFSTPVCSGSSDPSNCQGWQQFIYETDTNDVYMQYWLLDYGATCPTGWNPDQSSCFVNSPASTYTGSALTASDLATAQLGAQAAAGGADQVSLSTGTGHATLISNPDSMLDLAKVWNTAEFGVYGDAGSGEANFGAKTTLEAQTTLVGTSLSAPSCVEEGFTAETNNLNLTGTPKLGTEASPTIVSKQTNGTASKPSCATTSGSLTGTDEVTSDGEGDCALLSSGGVDCWGYGASGQLGTGKFFATGNKGSSVPLAVEGVGGEGALTGVVGLTGDDAGYCALLGSGGVDCWGSGANGELGNGTFYTTGNEGSAVPVQVEGVSGTGTLTGVTSLTSDGSNNGYCARLGSGGVDCWGSGANGELGNGTFYTTGNEGSAIPVQVEGVGGKGTLTGVSRLVSDEDNAVASSGGGYCGLLTSGKVDCWGSGTYGQLGNGTFYTTGNEGSAVPVQVKSLTGAGSLTSDGSGYCVVLTSGGVDCWGFGAYGQLGNGTFYTTGNEGSAVPVQVEGVGGTGTLTGATPGNLVSDEGAFGGGYCALLTSGAVDCWGYGRYGQLGNGTFYTTGNEGSAVPVQVGGLEGTGVSGLTSDGNYGYCVLLTSGAVECWGYGADGELGNGTFDTTGNEGSAVPVQVEGVGGTDALIGVVAVTSDSGFGYCAASTNGTTVDCWGYGVNGQLGSGKFYTTGNHGSAVPVKVE
jgi:alpha-tubulin suppressor-like RCC1 family protein